MTASYETIPAIAHIPFMGRLKNLLGSKFPGNFKLLEVGCGPGYFAELLKKEYQDRIQITAIDPSESAINQAKAKTDGGVDYRVATVADISTEEQLFDAILFTKSLHHVASLEETLGKARELMKTDGVLVIEDVDFEALNERTVGWFMDRIDLLHIAKVSHRHPEHEIASLLVQDMSVDSFKRWNTFFERAMKHHPMNHGHEHAMFGFKEMLDGTKKVFGQKNVHINARTVNLFQFASYVLNLQDTEVHRSILRTLLAQEQVAIEKDWINATGVIMVAEKSNFIQ